MPLLERRIGPAHDVVMGAQNGYQPARAGETFSAGRTDQMPDCLAGLR